MLEIILLIYLCNKIAKLSEQKNVSKRRWVLTTILYWISGEALGIFLVMTVIPVDADMFQPGKDLSKEFIYIMCAGLLGGYLGYLFTRKRMEDLPDADGRVE